MAHTFIALFRLLTEAVSVLFIIGVAGTTIVLLMTFLEDVKTILGKS